MSNVSLRTTTPATPLRPRQRVGDTETIVAANASQAHGASSTPAASTSSIDALPRSVASAVTRLREGWPELLALRFDLDATHDGAPIQRARLCLRKDTQGPLHTRIVQCLATLGWRRSKALSQVAGTPMEQAISHMADAMDELMEHDPFGGWAVRIAPLSEGAAELTGDAGDRAPSHWTPQGWDYAQDLAGDVLDRLPAIAHIEAVRMDTTGLAKAPPTFTYLRFIGCDGCVCSYVDTGTLRMQMHQAMVRGSGKHARINGMRAAHWMARWRASEVDMPLLLDALGILFDHDYHVRAIRRRA